VKESSSSSKPVGFKQVKIPAKKQTPSTPVVVVPISKKARGFFIPSEEQLKKRPQCSSSVNRKRSLTELTVDPVPRVERKDPDSLGVVGVPCKSSIDDPPAKKGKWKLTWGQESVLLGSPRPPSFNLGSVEPGLTKVKYRIPHPVTGLVSTGLRGTKRGVSESANMTQADYLTQLTRDNRAFGFNSIVPKSQGVYCSMQKAYIDYCRVIGTNLALTYISQTWLDMAKAEKIPVSAFRIWVLKGFISYCVNDKNGKPIKASSAENYLSAVRKLLLDMGIDVKFMDESQELKNVRKGAKNEEIGLPGNSVAEKQAIPITIDMAEIATTELLDIKSNLLDLALWLFCVMAYHFLCRLCELIKVKDTSHHLLSDRVVFTVMPLDEGPYKGVQPQKPLYVKSFDIDKYELYRIAGSTVNITDSKRDLFGRGDLYPNERELKRSCMSVYEMTELLYTWSVRAKPLQGEPFLSSSVGNFSISKSKVSKWCKKIARYFKLNPKRVYPHSLRYAGASALAAAGLPEYVIKKMGRWNSLAFLRYIRLSIDMFQQASRVLSNRATFSIRDIRLLCPFV